MLAARHTPRRPNSASLVSLVSSGYLKPFACTQVDLAVLLQPADGALALRRAAIKIDGGVSMTGRYAREGTSQHPTGRLKGRGRNSRDSRAIGAPPRPECTTSPSTVTEKSTEYAPTRNLTLPDSQGDGDEGLQPPCGPRAEVVE